jgi:hypothetical protein
MQARATMTTVATMMMGLALALTAACGRMVKPSSAFATNEISADYHVTLVDGGALVSARLFNVSDGFFPTTTTLSLDDEEFVAEFNGTAYPLSADDDAGSAGSDSDDECDEDEYEPPTSVSAVVPGVTAGDEVAVVLLRNAAVLRSSVEVPDAAIGGIEAGTTYSRSSDEISVSYVPLNNGSLTVSGDCIENLVVKTTAFSAWPLFGRFASTTIARGTVQQRANAPSATCTVTLRQARTNSGDVSNAFADGSITATDVDTIDVVSAP